jgi:CRISPR/Cas system-associated exonuclease Cas4 (RecB family)
MALSTKSKPYVIPEYSITGDLLSYLNCGLQYRYQNKGSLPPSTPVQLWFGEFIHGVMEEAYLEWRDRPESKYFPWGWKSHIHLIEMEIDHRMRSRGMSPPPNLFCPFGPSDDKQGLCPDTNHPHKLIASRRAESAINTWGKHLFPLIENAEVKLKSIRKMPNYDEDISRSNYFGVKGIIDVISSVNLQSAPSGNLIINYIHQNKELKEMIGNLSTEEYEIIIDYKGMRRPAIDSREWIHHQWQILTYAWLRSLQPESKKVVAGILFYLNELEISKQDMKELKPEVARKKTDIMPGKMDFVKILKWRQRDDVPNLSVPFKEERSIRLVPIEENAINDALSRFDNVVGEIEESVLFEIKGQDIMSSWKTEFSEKTCTACDFKNFCPNKKVNYSPTVP